MGGIGSGNRWQWGAKHTTADYLSVDVRRWHREGKIAPGQYFAWQWAREGERIGDIRVRTETDRVFLIYRHRNGGEWQEKNYPVYLDWTRCNYGGQRPWFLCPASGCARRVAVLYGGGVFACRHCHHLAYPSQNESVYERAARRSRKIVQLLGGDPYDEFFPDKPKHMHWSTYDRLLSEAYYYDERSYAGIMQLLASRA